MGAWMDGACICACMNGSARGRARARVVRACAACMHVCVCVCARVCVRVAKSPKNFPGVRVRVQVMHARESRARARVVGGCMDGSMHPRARVFMCAWMEARARVCACVVCMHVR